MTRRKPEAGNRKIDSWRSAGCAIDVGAVEIWPQPSPEEREAILLALRQVTTRRLDETQPRLAAWAAAGRDEALFGRVVKSRQGWARDAGRLAGW